MIRKVATQMHDCVLVEVPVCRKEASVNPTTVALGYLFAGAVLVPLMASRSGRSKQGRLTMAELRDSERQPELVEWPRSEGCWIRPHERAYGRTFLAPTSGSDVGRELQRILRPG